MDYKPKILIVDDKQENLYALENVLKGVQAEIIKADNGNDALIATLNNDFALVILDVQMPEMDGYELAELMRDEYETRYLPIIFLSAVFSDDFHIFKGYGSGAVDFITKPFNPDVLLAKVRIFLELNYQRVELERHRKELLKSNALMKSIMESPKDIAVFALDPGYRYINFNQNHKKMMKVMWGEDIEFGMNYLDMIEDPMAKEKTKYNFDRVLVGETFIIVEVREGETFPRSYKENRYNPIITEDGAIIGLTVFLTDITEQKQIEENLKLMNRQLREHIKERKRIEIALIESKKIAEDGRQAAEIANKKVMDSIRYAQMIQSSLLPNPENIRTFLQDSFFIWMPRDIVGGDFIFTDYFPANQEKQTGGGFIISVIDCTGHGVPGAFMTMIASFGLRKITGTEGFHDPAKILQRLNFLVQTTLHQDTEYALSDDGLDAAIAFLKPEDRTLTFAGAKLPLIYVHNDELHHIKGDRQSIGYKRSDVNFKFTNHTIRITRGMSFYMFSDGFVDQLGGEKRRRFGIRRFGNLLRENAYLPFKTQKDVLLEAFNDHKGENERQDDLTVIGFGFH